MIEKTKKEVYLDNTSTTRLDERVLEAMLPYLKEKYGNPLNVHSIGSAAKDGLDEARERVAQLIGAEDPREIIFTSCGSESNNLAIKGIAAAYQDKGKHIVVSAIEHFSVLYAARRLQKLGFDLSIVGVDKDGLLNPEELKKALRKDTILVSIQHANTEIGTIQSIKELAAAAKSIAKDIIFHTDAIGTVGSIELNIKELGVDSLSLAGSQFYGPKGAAALYLKKGVRATPQIDGGIQEEGRRAGTENVAGFVGLGEACRIAKIETAQNAKKIAALRDKLINELPEKIKYLYLNGPTKNRLPSNANFSVEFIEGEGMLLLLDQKWIYVSSGSACTSKALKLSHVLEAIKVDAAVAQGSVLFSLSKYNTQDDINYVLETMPAIVEKLRSISPIYAHFAKTGERMKVGPGTDYSAPSHE